MKTNPKIGTGRVLNYVVGALALAGALFVSGIGEVAEGSSLMVRLFFAFLGAIIAIQIIPCLILCGTIVRTLFGLIRGKTEPHAGTR